MLLRQHPRRQGVGRVAGQHRYHGLIQDGAHIQLGRHQVHRAAGELAARVNGALVRVQPGEGRQQRGMDVDQPPRVARDETRREDAHEPGQHHDGGVMAVDHLGQRGVEGLAAVESLVIQHLGGDALLAREREAPGIGLVTHHGRHAGVQGARPALLLRGTHDGGHVGAAARDQNHDVFHVPWIIPAMPFDPRTQPLSTHEARVLATLLEKARTVPDSYPLTLNSLVAGCNQKTSRDPVLQLSDADVLAALDVLRERTLVVEIGGARVARWEHNFDRGVGVPMQSAVLLGLLMLRGPQTAAELRLNAERWHRFADTSSVEAFLDELQERSDEKGGPLVTLLPRAPGARESRWTQLLCGAVDVDALRESSASAPTAPALQGRVEALEAEVAQLQATVHRLCTELGLQESMSPPGQD